MPTRPNHRIDPTTGTEANHLGELQAPPQAHLDIQRFDGNEYNDMTQPIDLDGSIDIRVDCQCNAYARETVHVPYAVIYDALLDDTPNIKLWSRDDRITATRVGGITGPPSRDFKPVHLAQAAASMRQAKLIPFSPFVRPATLPGLKARDAYTRFEQAHHEATNDPNPPPEPPPTEPAPTTPTTEPIAAETQTGPGPYPKNGSVADIQTWVGDDTLRATHARNEENTRRRGPRITLTTWLDEHFGPARLIEVLTTEEPFVCDECGDTKDPDQESPDHPFVCLDCAGQ